jgi:serpin B
LQEVEYTLYMPKFRYESSFSLKEALAAMGMTDAFYAERADLSGMDGKRDRDLFVSAVVHKALVRVDEEGTEAAAATAVVIRMGGAPGGEPLVMVVDRPFIFLIRDVKTGAILFIGRVVDPRG